MITLQDLQAVGLDETARMDFVLKSIRKHTGSSEYMTAVNADAYNRLENPTIRNFQKLLYTMTGRVVPDNYSANYKIASGFLHRFATQENQYLLGNGVSFENDTTKDRLGEDFDNQIIKAGINAILSSVSFGFFNLDHIQVFRYQEFVPIYDEENGALSAGIRFWQIDLKKPLRATLYEIDGYTDYIWKDGVGEVVKEKRPYKISYSYSDADGLEIYNGENYPAFPIVPLWGNSRHESLLTGLQEQIDCYDLIKSGFANTVDEASIFYWTIQNAGGMDDVDLAQFVERMRTVHAATVEDSGARAEAHTMDAPFESREKLLERLEKDLYKDAMALDTEHIASGATTATQIRAAYEPLNAKTDDFEYCVIDFIKGLLTVAGIDDNPTFTRSMIVNTQEEIQTVLQAAQYLDDEYVTRKILTLLGDGDQADDVLKRMDEKDQERLTSSTSTVTDTDEPEGDDIDEA